MENSKNKTDNFLKAIKKYADEQRSAMQTEVAQLKEEKLKEATEKGRRQRQYIRTNLQNRETVFSDLPEFSLQEYQSACFLILQVCP